MHVNALTMNAGAQYFLLDTGNPNHKKFLIRLLEFLPPNFFTLNLDDKNNVLGKLIDKEPNLTMLFCEFPHLAFPIINSVLNDNPYYDEKISLAAVYFCWEKCSPEQLIFLLKLIEFLPKKILNEHTIFTCELWNQPTFIAFLNLYPDFAVQLLMKAVDKNEQLYNSLEEKRFSLPQPLQKSIFTSPGFLSSGRIYATLLLTTPVERQATSLAFVLAELKKPRKTTSAILEIVASSASSSPPSEPDKENIGLAPISTKADVTIAAISPRLLRMGT
jgi:hypothetical protein